MIEWKITIDGLLVVLATVFSPMVALYVSDKREKMRFQKERQLDIFRTLIKRPFTIYTIDHELMCALNLVYVEFNSHPNIIKARQELQKFFNQPILPDNLDLLKVEMARLLEEITKVLDIKISAIDILHGQYLPNVIIAQLDQRNNIDNALLKVLNGEKAIAITMPPEPHNIPSDAIEDS